MIEVAAKKQVKRTRSNLSFKVFKASVNERDSKVSDRFPECRCSQINQSNSFANILYGRTITKASVLLSRAVRSIDVGFPRFVS